MEHILSFEEHNKMLYEMASVGYFSTLKNNGNPESPRLKVFVNGSEGNEPHIHIWDDNTNGQEFHTCVCLNKVEYFHHDGKEDKLTTKQKEFWFYS